MNLGQLIKELQSVKKHAGEDAEVFIGDRKLPSGGWILGSIRTEQRFDSDGDAHIAQVTINPVRA